MGLYANRGAEPISREEFWEEPANVELRGYGIKGFTDEDGRSSCLWFDLELTGFHAKWKGKMIVRWPPPERSWHRWAHKPKNNMPIHAILEDSAFEGPGLNWDEIDLKWQDLQILPPGLKSKLREWRGIYFIVDDSDGKGYVGAAYGDTNLLGRWENYAARGHGGNSKLRTRDPSNFRFTILQRVSPDLGKTEVEELEASWKRRLHTREHGLNEN